VDAEKAKGEKERCDTDYEKGRELFFTKFLSHR